MKISIQLGLWGVICLFPPGIQRQFFILFTFITEMWWNVILAQYPSKSQSGGSRAEKVLLCLPSSDILLLSIFIGEYIENLRKFTLNNKEPLKIGWGSELRADTNVHNSKWKTEVRFRRRNQKGHWPEHPWVHSNPWEHLSILLVPPNRAMQRCMMLLRTRIRLKPPH